MKICRKRIINFWKCVYSKFSRVVASLLDTSCSANSVYVREGVKHQLVAESSQSSEPPPTPVTENRVLS